MERVARNTRVYVSRIRHQNSGQILQRVLYVPLAVVWNMCLFCELLRQCLSNIYAIFLQESKLVQLPKLSNVSI